MQDLAAISKSFEESQLESFKSGFYVNKERIYKKYQKYTQANRLAIRYAVRHMSITPDLKLKSRFHSKDFLTEDITLNINSQKYRKSPHLP